MTKIDKWPSGTLHISGVFNEMDTPKITPEEINDLGLIFHHPTYSFTNTDSPGSVLTEDHLKSAANKLSQSATLIANSFTAFGSSVASFNLAVDQVGTLVYMGTSKTWNVASLYEDEGPDPKLSDLLIGVECKNGHEVVKGGDDFSDPCSICGVEIKSFSLDRATLTMV